MSTPTEFDKELDKLLQPYAATEISEAIKQAVYKYVIGEDEPEKETFMGVVSWVKGWANVVVRNRLRAEQRTNLSNSKDEG